MVIGKGLPAFISLNSLLAKVSRLKYAPLRSLVFLNHTGKPAIERRVLDNPKKKLCSNIDLFGPLLLLLGSSTQLVDNFRGCILPLGMKKTNHSTHLKKYKSKSKDGHHYNTVRTDSAFGYHTPAPERIITIEQKPTLHYRLKRSTK